MALCYDHLLNCVYKTPESLQHRRAFASISSFLPLYLGPTSVNAVMINRAVLTLALVRKRGPGPVIFHIS